jgi:tartrate dehydratase alpha subunit/fumarate hydratase class I-like protein
MSRKERKVAFMKRAEKMFEEIENWYDQNPEASFEEIEERARQARRKMMGKSLGVVINGRDVGKTEEAPKCEQCGQAMVFKDYRNKKVYGLEGETELERAYYVCEVCEKQTFFPPG